MFGKLWEWVLGPAMAVSLFGAGERIANAQFHDMGPSYTPQTETYDPPVRAIDLFETMDDGRILFNPGRVNLSLRADETISIPLGMDTDEVSVNFRLGNVGAGYSGREQTAFEGNVPVTLRPLFDKMDAFGLKKEAERLGRQYLGGRGETLSSEQVYSLSVEDAQFSLRQVEQAGVRGTRSYLGVTIPDVFQLQQAENSDMYMLGNLDAGRGVRYLRGAIGKTSAGTDITGTDVSLAFSGLQALYRDEAGISNTMRLAWSGNTLERLETPAVLQYRADLEKLAVMQRELAGGRTLWDANLKPLNTTLGFGDDYLLARSGGTVGGKPWSFQILNDNGNDLLGGSYGDILNFQRNNSDLSVASNSLGPASFAYTDLQSQDTRNLVFPKVMKDSSLALFDSPAARGFRFQDSARGHLAEYQQTPAGNTYSARYGKFPVTLGYSDMDGLRVGYQREFGDIALSLGQNPAFPAVAQTGLVSVNTGGWLRGDVLFDLTGFKRADVLRYRADLGPEKGPWKVSAVKDPAQPLKVSWDWTISPDPKRPYAFSLWGEYVPNSPLNGGNDNLSAYAVGKVEF